MKRKEGDRVQHYQRNYGVMVRESVLNTDVEKRNIFVRTHTHKQTYIASGNSVCRSPVLK